MAVVLAGSIAPSASKATTVPSRNIFLTVPSAHVMTMTSFSMVKLPEQVTTAPAVSSLVTNVKAAMSKVVYQKAPGTI